MGDIHFSIAELKENYWVTHPTGTKRFGIPQICSGFEVPISEVPQAKRQEYEKEVEAFRQQQKANKPSEKSR